MTVGTEAVIDAKRSIGHNGLKPDLRRCGATNRMAGPSPERTHVL